MEHGDVREGVVHARRHHRHPVLVHQGRVTAAITVVAIALVIIVVDVVVIQLRDKVVRSGGARCG